jgi:DeoR family glycerol-3-phosphate regulon repressor
VNQIDKTSNQREEEIMREIRLAGGSCRVSYLSTRLNVSNETIRRNIKTLEEAGVVRKVHGGVRIVEQLTEAPFDSRMEMNSKTKELLAIAVAETINNGDSIFLDIGSTTAYIAIALRQHHNLYVVTNSVFVANTLATRNNNRVFLAGGELRQQDGGSFGAQAIDFIKKFNTQVAIISVGAVNSEMGFMCHDLEEASIAEIAISRSQVKIVVTDHDKFEKRAPIALNQSNRFDILFTDQYPPESITKMLKQNDIELVVPSTIKHLSKET